MTSPPTASVITARGRGAVAAIEFHGPPTLLDRGGDLPGFRAANGKPLAEVSPQRIVFGYWEDAQTSEEVVVIPVAVEIVEIHCHGGDAAVERILRDLRGLGCEILPWTVQAERQSGLFEAEWQEALSRAATFHTASLLLSQRNALPAAIQGLLNRLDDPLEELRQAVAELRAWSRIGLHLTAPWSVVLAGPPNVGKSSLINALVGYSRSIVYDQPGTTRDIVQAETAFAGWPVRLTDTAGLRAEADELETLGMAQAVREFRAADCQLLLFDVGQPLDDGGRQLLRDWPQALCIAHKSDLPAVCLTELPPTALSVSSHTGEGIEELMQAVLSRLLPTQPTAEQPLPFTARQVQLLDELAESLQTGGDREVISSRLRALIR